MSIFLLKCLLFCSLLLELYFCQSGILPSDIKTAKGVDLNDPMTSFDSIESLLDLIPESKRVQAYRILYGKTAENKFSAIPKDVIDIADQHNFEVKSFSMVKNALKEEIRTPRIVTIGVIQNSIVEPTNVSVIQQYLAIQNKIEVMIDAAARMGVNVLCLQEAWTMPFAFCNFH